MTSTIDKLQAILRRDLLTAVRHRSGIVVTLVGVFFELAAFYFLYRARFPTRWCRVLPFSSRRNRSLHFLRDERPGIFKLGAGGAADRNA